MGDDLINDNQDVLEEYSMLYKCGIVFIAGTVLVLSYIGDQPSDFG